MTARTGGTSDARGLTARRAAPALGDVPTHRSPSRGLRQAGAVAALLTVLALSGCQHAGAAGSPATAGLHPATSLPSSPSASGAPAPVPADVAAALAAADQALADTSQSVSDADTSAATTDDPTG
jgi:hypothetical protein